MRDDGGVSTSPPPDTVLDEDQPAPAPGRRRGLESIRDMVLSMALVGAVVLAVFWMVAWQRPEVQGPIRPDVDVASVFEQFAVGEPFPVLQPTGLPTGWVANSAWFEPATATLDRAVLHVGYITPGGSYAEVLQSDGSSAQVTAEWVDDATKVGTRTIDGARWTVVESAETGKQGLVLDHEGTTVVVTGKADLDELTELARSLQ